MLFIKRALMLSMMLVGLAACGEGSDVDKSKYTKLADVPAEKLALLSQHSYFFGHQSVGTNVVDGLALVLKDNPNIKLSVAESEEAAHLKPGAFLHSRIGKNSEPATKVEAFQRLLDSGMGNKVDAAFVKFCYVDAGTGANATVDETFANYKRTISELQARYPQTRFIHFTMPLRTVPDGIKIKIKNVLGRDIPEYLDNAQRGHFNELLRQEYGGKEPVFDIAHLESVAAGGGKAYTFEYQGKKLETLAPENTYDGGHLSDDGKRWVAEQLLIFLAQLEYKS